MDTIKSHQMQMNPYESQQIPTYPQESLDEYYQIPFIAIEYHQIQTNSYMNPNEYLGIPLNTIETIKYPQMPLNTMV